MQDPKVSVCVITYNQENYISKCLESILGQQTSFDYDIVIGEDCSPDNTAKLIETYANQHTNITVLDNAKNLGAIANFIRTLSACKGQYIAFCEGDDYWIDDYKLQKQVDFLEQNPQYGGVCTNNRWFLENEKEFKDSIIEEGVVTFENLTVSNAINSQTMLFKRELIKDLSWLSGLKIGDWALHLLITSQQPYYRLPEITTVYRVHEGGVHSLLQREYKIRYRLEVIIAVLDHINLTTRQQELLKQTIRKLLVKLIAYHPKDVKNMREAYSRYGGSLFNKVILKSYLK